MTWREAYGGDYEVSTSGGDMSEQVIKELKLTKDQWEVLHKIECETEAMKDMITTVIDQLAQAEVERHTDKWNEVARMLGYDNYHDAHSRGINLRISLLRNTITAFVRTETEGGA